MKRGQITIYQSRPGCMMYSTTEVGKWIRVMNDEKALGSSVNILPNGTVILSVEFPKVK